MNKNAVNDMVPLYASTIEQLKMLSEAERMQALNLIVNYGLYDEKPSDQVHLSPLVNVVFISACERIDHYYRLSRRLNKARKAKAEKAKQVDGNPWRDLDDTDNYYNL